MIKVATTELINDNGGKVTTTTQIGNATDDKINSTTETTNDNNF